MLAGHIILFRFPLHSKRRVGQHVVELLVRMTVAVNLPLFLPARAQRVAKGNVLHIFALDKQVGTADGVGFGVVLLSEQFHVRIGVLVADIFLRHRQHAARPAGRIVDFKHLAGGVDNFVARKQQAHHQVNHFAGRKVVSRLLVGLLIKPPHKVFKNIAHVYVGNAVGMEVNR